MSRQYTIAQYTIRRRSRKSKKKKTVLDGSSFASSCLDRFFSFPWWLEDRAFVRHCVTVARHRFVSAASLMHLLRGLTVSIVRKNFAVNSSLPDSDDGQTKLCKNILYVDTSLAPSKACSFFGMICTGFDGRGIFFR